MALNINRSVKDLYYRYKMPRLQAKIEGKGNGIKTVIANLTDIAKALDRPPVYALKFLGPELAASTKVKDERYIINGAHDANKLQDLLDIFIKKFVLCPQCDNPETVLTVKRDTINSKCKACGHAYIIDPKHKHKVSNYIVKNPPPSTDVSKSEKKKDSGSPKQCKISRDAKEDYKNSDDIDDDWAEPLDCSQNPHLAKYIRDKDMDKSLDERLEMLKQFLFKAKNDSTLHDYKKLLHEANRLELEGRAALVLAHILFDNDILTQIETYKTLLYPFLKEKPKSQRRFLGGIEQLVEKHLLLSSAPDIIKKLHEAKLVQKTVLLAWGAKPSSKYIKKDFAKEIITCCQPVLKKLDEAEGKSENGVEIVFDERPCGVYIISTVIHVASKTPPVEDEGDEINIDDI